MLKQHLLSQIVFSLEAMSGRIAKNISMKELLTSGGLHQRLIERV